MHASAPASDADLLLPSFYGAHGYPHDRWAQLRREDPVHRVEDWAGDPYWALLRYQDIREVSRRPRLFTNWPRFNVNPRKGVPDEPYHNLLNMDPPQHGVYRSIVNRRFTPRALGQMESEIDRICDDVIDTASAANDGSAVDLVETISSRVPIWVIAEMMGLPREDWEALYEWTNISVGAEDPEFQQGRSTQETRTSVLAEMGAYFARIVAERRSRPRDDIASDLANAKVDGEHLPPLELLSYFSMLLAAGNETTRNAITGGVMLLLSHPEEMEKLRRSPGRLLRPFVEETLRFVSPVIHMSRTAARDTEIRGRRIRAGEPVVLFFPSGNRDESVFDAPDEFRVDRHPNPHIAFGVGEHFCLGSHVARMELRAMFRKILQRLDFAEIAGPVEYLHSHVVGGVKRLPVRFRWREAA